MPRRPPSGSVVASSASTHDGDAADPVPGGNPGGTIGPRDEKSGTGAPESTYASVLTSKTRSLDFLRSESVFPDPGGPTSSRLPLRSRFPEGLSPGGT